MSSISMVGISEAARLAGCSRQHIYNLAEAGKLSVQKELIAGRNGHDKSDYRQTIDVAELSRVFGRLATIADSKEVPNAEFLQFELAIARSAIADRDVQLRDAKTREEWLHKQMEEVTSTLKLISFHEPSRSEQAEIAVLNATVQRASRVVKSLRAQLAQEKNKGFWQRVIRGR
jgi:hypothetical protein